MDGEARRKAILKQLKNSDKPISATALANDFHVSRQIIVGDIALLRAKNTEIIATNRGYILSKSEGNGNMITVIKCIHRNADLYDELCSIVDAGGRVLDIYIEHNIYGRISVPLNIRNRADAQQFMEKMMDNRQKPLEDLTDGVHYHTIETDNEIGVLRIQKSLNDKGYLLKQ